MIALTLIALVSIRKWTTDTHAERGRLAEAMREADTERGRSVAVQAAMEVERARIRRDAAAELERMEARLRAERQAIRDQLEEERARMACESLGIAFRMIKAGLLEDRPAEEHGKVIGFPGAARAREEADCDAAACDREVSRP
ncbi:MULTISPECIES: hypothetical protein [unclassified Streptomyces]|uniref:hypothetical protein n=1 Tax=unclassified Streptomyces TaxID=2593676 RepID=UPI00114CA14B|nr:MULTISPECIES: hypothetical protein [unclassified Streptomyces]MYZ37517.1 hypothetical protein [Streptomyces sp. SID4917]